MVCKSVLMFSMFDSALSVCVTICYDRGEQLTTDIWCSGHVAWHVLLTITIINQCQHQHQHTVKSVLSNHWWKANIWRAAGVVILAKLNLPQEATCLIRPPSFTEICHDIITVHRVVSTSENYASVTIISWKLSPIIDSWESIKFQKNKHW